MKHPSQCLAHSKCSRSVRNYLPSLPSLCLMPQLAKRAKSMTASDFSLSMLHTCFLPIGKVNFSSSTLPSTHTIFFFLKPTYAFFRNYLKSQILTLLGKISPLFFLMLQFWLSVNCSTRHPHIWYLKTEVCCFSQFCRLPGQFLVLVEALGWLAVPKWPHLPDKQLISAASWSSATAVVFGPQFCLTWFSPCCCLSFLTAW